MRKTFVLLLFYSAIPALKAQQLNITSTNPLAEQVMKGMYNPVSFQAPVVITHPDSTSKGIHKRVSADSMHKYLVEMASFGNRNTGADTLSTVKGIGAARKWAFKKFQHFSAQNNGRLIPSYLKFDQTICGVTQHKNIFAVLPGSDTTDKSIVLIEAHIDSRCEGLCDTSCVAQGMEDNGSGSALVLELARVMSRYTYRNTIVFMLTISEEQGLYGAEAFANYALQKNIKVKAVLNNDVIGGVICGNTSSPPSCPGVGNIDSTHVRLFSFGGFNSPHKGLARFVKLQYNEMIRPQATVPMTLHVMTPEDRTGRGGDHIPFRMKGITAIRFTSANEHGNANVSNFNYSDRQHTSRDSLGVDTDNDLSIDSFFVDFNYLARNAVINGNAAAMAAAGPKTPDFAFEVSNGTEYKITIIQQTQYQQYRVGLRTSSNDWDAVYTFTGSTFSVSLPTGNYIASVASVDSLGIESLFSRESFASDVTSLKDISGIPAQMLQIQPNPADEATSVMVLISDSFRCKKASIVISDLSGRIIEDMPIVLTPGVNEVQYNHGYHAQGTYLCSLVVDGRTIETRRMVFSK